MNQPRDVLKDEVPAPEPAQCIDSHALITQRYLQWLEENGATFSATELKLEPGLREIYAARRIRRGELAMHIPPALLITPAMAKASPIGLKMKASGATFSDYAYLSAFILMTKHAGGFFKPYVDTLPEAAPGMPMLYTEEELAYLKGSCQYGRVTSQVEWIKYEHYHLAKLFAPEHTITEEEYTWAKAHVTSRVHGGNVDGNKVSIMVPLADMPNHARNENLRWKADASLGFIYITYHTVEPGTPLTITYGREKGNGVLLRVYGFCLPDNPNDFTEIAFPKLADDHPCATLSEPLGSTRDNVRYFEPTASSSHSKAREMLSYLRMFTLTEAGNTDGPLSKENETAALTMLAEACRARLKDFDTTLEADAALLDDPSLSQNVRHAVSVRLGEMRVLHYYLELAAAGLAQLEGKVVACGGDMYFDSLKTLIETGEARTQGEAPAVVTAA